MSPLGGSDTYWEKRAFEEAVRLVMRKTGLPGDRAAAELLAKYQASPLEAQQALQQAVDAVVADHPHPEAGRVSGLRAVWHRLTR